MRIFLLLLMLCGFPVSAEQTSSVTDLTGMLTTEEQTVLTQQLQTLEQQNHVQVAVLVTPTTEGKSIKLAASQAYGLYHWKPTEGQRYGEGILVMVMWPKRQVALKMGPGLEEILPPEQAAQIIRYRMQSEFEKNNLFAGLTRGIEGIALFTHTKASLSPLDALANHLFTNPQRSLPCLAWTLLMIVAIVVLWRFTRRPGPGIWMISMITPMVWFFFFQDDVIIRRVSIVCFSLFFAAICWQRLTVIFHMCRAFPMTQAPKNKNTKMKKPQQIPESGRNSLLVVLLIIVVGWSLVFASNKDIALISTIIGLIDYFIGPITVAGIVLLIVVAIFTGNLKLGAGEKSNRKTGSRNAHSRSSSGNSFRGGGGSSGGGGASGRW
ncbi:TPM domain-containing protein [Escherichia albertii]|uniref:TPM domain-containing protein n=1 Tax=Escherichia albertii TaxID=208962 RepID=UPI0010BCDDA1|nr:TPM domain-containing protein [Escherichia albertii]MCZ8664451.1 TPM domain-containing protein [Escherichia albertii]HEB0986940.1 TPM domain-containing protein [Escherichia albertii]HEB0991450.1 TPM domain-containing protein [Escherichia albertii]HEB0996013.1 TPM domain-containing protein [Escherichia albertii]HEB1000593.1 TPM domain-containing protein [Escherichia albertii]